MADKDFKVKNKLVLNGLAQAGILLADASKQVDSVSYLTAIQGGTGTTTAPSAGQILYSQSGTTYSPTTLKDLVTQSTYATSAPSNPSVGDLWVDSDDAGDTFDPNIIRRKTVTATAGQTVFTTDVSFIDGYEQVYYNGVLLVRTTDYTTNGSTNTVTLLQGASAGDTVEILTVTNLNSVNTYTQAEINSALDSNQVAQIMGVY